MIAKCKSSRLEHVVKELSDYGFADIVLVCEHQHVTKNVNEAVTTSEGTMSKLEECLELLRNDRDAMHVHHNAAVLAF